MCERRAEVRNEYHDECVGKKKVSVKCRPPPPPKPTKPKRALDGKLVITMDTGETMREVLIPSKDPNYYPIMLKEADMERLAKQAIFMTEEERQVLCKESEERKERLKDESMARKLKLQMIDKERAGDGSRLTAMQQDAKDKANYLLERAWELLKENEDEVKAANSLILKTKCQAIRDAQIAERILIQKELAEEKKKEGLQMEGDKLRQVEEEKQRQEEEKVKQAKYIRELNLQVAEIEAERMIEAEKKIMDRRRVMEAMFVELWEEKEKECRIQKEKEELKKALDQANQSIQRAQEIDKEEDRIAELKMQEFMRLKAEREERLQREKLEAAKKKELETARLRALQEQAGDLQSVLDEQAAVRRQEEYEREWRRKELEAAKKKKQIEIDLKKGRDQQVADIRKTQAVELGREKREYEKVIRVQMGIQDREKQAELEKKKRAVKYREEILNQINEKDRTRIEELRDKYAEGMALRAVEAKRTTDIKKVLTKKVDCLRHNKIPEVYIHEIQRQFCL